MKSSTPLIGRGAHRTAGPRARRTWMPVTDSWIGSADSRLWNRSEDMNFDWSATDPWTHRVQLS